MNKCGIRTLIIGVVLIGLALVISALLLSQLAGAEHGDLMWEETYGGPNTDWGRAVVETPDGGLVIVGDTKPQADGKRDVWLLKVDEEGGMNWSRTFGGAGDDLGFSLNTTSDGGFIITGFLNGDDKNARNALLMKTDADGNEVWNRTFGGSEQDEGRSVIQTNDGGYILLGSTASEGAGNLDLWLIKTNATGSEEWSQTYGGPNRDEGRSIQQTQDGGYIIAGRAEPNGAGNLDLWLLRVDENGTEIWSDTWGGSKMDEGWSILETADGGFVVAGRTASSGAGAMDVWLIRTDSAGKEEWKRTFGGTEGDVGRFLSEAPDGEYIITGRTRSKGAGDFDVWLVMINEDGDLVDDWTYGGNQWDEARGIIVDRNGDYVITGRTSSSGNGMEDLWILKVHGPPRTWIVDDDGGADFTEIKDAIQAAREGDIIKVFEGTYDEQIIIDKSLVLIGNGSDVVTIDGGGNGDVVHITSDRVTISGFKITGSGMDQEESGIRVESNQSRIMKNDLSGNNYGINLFRSNECIVENNTCSSNEMIGINLWYSTTCFIRMNTCGYNLGGIYLDNFSSDCEVLNNTCFESIRYGISIFSSDNCLILNNTCSSGNREGMIIRSNHCVIRNNICSENNQEGINIESYSNDCIIENNTCENNGLHGIDISRTNHSIVRGNRCVNNLIGISISFSDLGTLTENTCESNEQSGIYVWTSNEGTIERNILVRNGIGLNLDDSDNCTITNNTFSENTEGINLKTSSFGNVAHLNSLIDNRDSAINASYNNGFFINATNNWWGHETGPYHPSKNPSGNGDNITDFVKFEENERPHAHIDAISPQLALDTDLVSFQGHGTDDRTVHQYAWRSSLDGEFHNDSISDFEMDALTVGNHTIFFKVQDNYGVWSEEVHESLVVTELPVAIIGSISPSPSLVTHPVSFEGHGTDDGTITNYSWRSDIDGELYNGSNKNFTTWNLTLGVHNVSLQVQDNDGFWSDIANVSLNIRSRPIATLLDILPDPALTTEVVTFRSSPCDDQCDYNETQYVWRSSISGELHRGENATWNISGLEAGNHTIFLMVQDDYGFWSDEVNTTLIVHELPIANILDILPNLTTEGESITFSGNGTDDGSIIIYKWWAGSNVLYFGPDPQFTIDTLSPGIHMVNLTVRDDLGAWSTEISMMIEVLQDRDHDGVADIHDLFPDDSTEWEDTDGDGTGDASDAFPNDLAASLDSDGDGYPDAWNTGHTEANSTTGLLKDFFPADPLKWEEEKDEGGFIPGFEIVMAVIAIGCSFFTVLLKRRWYDSR